jgi:hypothetical protein
MSKEERDRDRLRLDRDAATKAVLDNMAKLKALRLAREAAAPAAPAAAKKARAKSTATGKKGPAPPLSDWLVNQQSGGRRT